jgi:AcrR family transcriptional regulator
MELDRSRQVRCHFVQCRTKLVEASHLMQNRTKPSERGGRPREFNEAEALGRMQRELLTTGLSGASLDGIARAAGLNRPSVAAAFGDKNAIYKKAAAQFAAMMDARLSAAMEIVDLSASLQAIFDAAIDIYTAGGPDGCFVICTAPAEALTNPSCRAILEQSVEATDERFLRRLKLERARMKARRPDLPLLAAQLGATLHSLAIRARAGWSPKQLRGLAAFAVRQVVAEVG